MSNASEHVLEICAASLESVHEALAGGADRIELCSNLFCGGTTPSHGLLQATMAVCNIPVHVLIRPRAGDFCYSESEIKVICRDIEWAKEAGAAGIVCGFLLPDGNIDLELTALMVELASPMSVTFHRAFDICRDPAKGLEDIIAAGCHRVLTSGQKNIAFEGRELIAALVKQADNRIIIMPGSGINADNMAALIETGATEFHMSGSVNQKSQSRFSVEAVLLSDNPVRDEEIQITSREKVRAAKEAMSS